MDIGPVRGRLTAEPLSSPVPGETSPAQEPVIVERADEPVVAHAEPEPVTTSRT